jgi:hypothetical protein
MLLDSLRGPNQRSEPVSSQQTVTMQDQQYPTARSGWLRASLRPLTGCSP